MVAILKDLEGEVGEDSGETEGDRRVQVGVAATAKSEVNRPIEGPQHAPIRFECVERGEKAADLWGGIRNKQTGDPWEQNTMVVVHSATKGLAAWTMTALRPYGGRVALLAILLPPLDALAVRLLRR